MDIGLKALGTYAQLDNAVSVSAANSANGSDKDLGTSSPLPMRVRAKFALTQTGTTNKASLEVRVQFFDTAATYPDNTEGDLVFSWDANALGLSAGADLGMSVPVVFSPKGRYYRFRYKNNNGTDSFTVSAWVAEDLGYAA